MENPHLKWMRTGDENWGYPHDFGNHKDALFTACSPGFSQQRRGSPLTIHQFRVVVVPQFFQGNPTTSNQDAPRGVVRKPPYAPWCRMNVIHLYPLVMADIAMENPPMFNR